MLGVHPVGEIFRLTGRSRLCNEWTDVRLLHTEYRYGHTQGLVNFTFLYQFDLKLFNKLLVAQHSTTGSRPGRSHGRSPLKMSIARVDLEMVFSREKKKKRMGLPRRKKRKVPILRKRFRVGEQRESR